MAPKKFRCKRGSRAGGTKGRVAPSFATATPPYGVVSWETFEARPKKSVVAGLAASIADGRPSELKEEA